MQVEGKPLDWQVTSITQICSAIAPLLAQTEVLTLGILKGGPDPAAAAGWQVGDVAVIRAQWRSLFRILSGVKTMELFGVHAGDALRATAQPRHRESNAGGNGMGGGEGGGNAMVGPLQLGPLSKSYLC